MKRSHDCGSHAAVLFLKSAQSRQGFLIADHARDSATLGGVGGLALCGGFGAHESSGFEFVNHPQERGLDCHISVDGNLDNHAAVAVDLDNHKAAQVVARLQAFPVLHNVALLHFAFSVSGQSRPCAYSKPSLVTCQAPSATFFGVAA
jgi:hypothetical protein